MDRAQLLKHELQVQQARIVEENQRRAQMLDNAYKAVSDLNFLGLSPYKLRNQIPEEFLRGAYSQGRLPKVEFPKKEATIASASASIPEPVPVVHPPIPHVTKRSTLIRKEKRKRQTERSRGFESGPVWDSEWVAPQSSSPIKPTRFGDNTWSSKLSINLDSSDSEPDSESEIENLSLEELDKRESDLMATVNQLHIDEKSQENHIRQLEERLEKQRKTILEKQEALSANLGKYKQAVEELNGISAQPIKRMKVIENNDQQKSLISSKVSPPAQQPSESKDKDVKVGQGITKSKASAGKSSIEAQKQDMGEPIPTADTKMPLKADELGTNRGSEGDSQEDKDPSSNSDLGTISTSNAYKVDSPIFLFNYSRHEPAWTGQNPLRAYSRTFNSPFVKDGELCETELNGKNCATKGCPNVHFADYDVPEQQILTHILKEYVDADTTKVFSKKLRSLKNPNGENSMALLQKVIAQETF